MRMRRVAAAALVVGVATALLSGCTSGGSKSTTQTGVAPGKKADIVNWAGAPQANPDWIWPFSGLDHFTQTNAGDFQALMYRPLYWFGDAKGSPLLNTSLSLAAAPTFSADGLTATVKLKPYKWSNGETVTSKNVLFWFNLEKAEKANWAAYSPGQFPDNVKSVTTPDASTISFTFDKKYSQQWLTYNQLGQITPMPTAWDLTSATAKGSCSTTVSACKPVYTFLNAQSKDLQSYATSKIWSVVDGPWKLKSFNADGHVSFVPNASYSGPVKPKLKQFNEVPFTSDASEFNVLRSGNTLDAGYIPIDDISQPHPAGKSVTTVGANPLARNYRMSISYSYGANYYPFNFNSTKSGAVFKQLYFRQAFQSLVDQTGIIDKLGKGYGLPTTGPIPLYPTNSPLISSFEKARSTFAYSVSNATSLLTQHGWTVKKGGVTTCTSPGSGANQCGAGIAAGQGLEFRYKYAGGSKSFDNYIAVLKSDEAQAGIKLDVSSSTFNNVIGEAVPTNKNWDINNWGGGWIYVPDYYPTGELIFQTGAGSNSGAYSNKSVDALIDATTTTSGVQVMQSYEDALAKDLPVVWQPTFATGLAETATALKGNEPANPFGFITPENWHY